MTVPSNLVPLRLSQMTPAVSLTGDELLWISQTGVSKSTTITAAVAAGAIGALTASFLTLAAASNLPNERIFTPGTGLSAVDGGAGSPYTLGLANTAVAAGSYGSDHQVGAFTVDAQGRLTSASNITITPASIGGVASVTGTANQITVTGTVNPILSLSSTLIAPGTVTALLGAVNLSPANAAVTLSPTGTGVVTIAPATAGTLNNVVIGGSTPLAGTFTTATANSFIPNGSIAPTVGMYLPAAAVPEIVSGTNYAFRFNNNGAGPQLDLRRNALATLAFRLGATSSQITIEAREDQPISFLNSAGVEQVRVTSTGGAANYLTLTGGTNPTISVSGGSLAITPATVFASSVRATAVAIGNSPSGLLYVYSAAATTHVRPILQNQGGDGYNADINYITTNRNWLVGASDSASGVDSSGCFVFYDSTAAAYRGAILSTGEWRIGGISTGAGLVVGVAASSNRFVQITPSNGAEPIIGTSGGNLAIMPGGAASAQFGGTNSNGRYFTLTGTSSSGDPTFAVSGGSIQFGSAIKLDAANTVSASIATASTNKVLINVGGTDYYFLVTTVP